MARKINESTINNILTDQRTWAVKKNLAGEKSLFAGIRNLNYKGRNQHTAALTDRGLKPIFLPLKTTKSIDKEEQEAN